MVMLLTQKMSHRLCLWTHPQYPQVRCGRASCGPHSICRAYFDGFVNICSVLSSRESKGEHVESVNGVYSTVNVETETTQW